MKVKSCQVFNSFNGTGIAVLTYNNRIFVVNNVEDVRIRRLAQITGKMLSLEKLYQYNCCRSKLAVSGTSAVVQISCVCIYHQQGDYKIIIGFCSQTKLAQ